MVRQRRLVRAVGLETFCAAFDVKHEYQDCSDTLPNKHEPKRSGEPARCLRCYLVERVLRLQSDEVDHVWSSEETVLSLNKEGMERYGV